MKERLLFGKMNIEKIETLLGETCSMEDTQKISYLSKTFLGFPYKEHPLPSENEEEVLVISFEGFDCLTFLETIEALRLSRGFLEFKKNLRKIRYKDGVVAYENRNHFFTDWIYYNNSVFDATTLVGGEYTRIRKKTLNLRKDGTFILKGLTPFERKIAYIPKKAIPFCLKRLKNGDYIGIYTDKEGIDCCHVGIFIEDKGEFIFRHASSKKPHKEVKDDPFDEYTQKKDGIIILRPRSTKDIS